MTDKTSSSSKAAAEAKPHPATLPRASQQASKRTETVAQAPHPATLSRSAAPVSKPKAPRGNSSALADVSAALPVIDTARLAKNWSALLVRPPHEDIRLEAAQSKQELPAWGFECRGVSGRVSYDAGPHNIAHVSLRPSAQEKLMNFWFMVDARRPGQIINAEPGTYAAKSSERPFSALPSALQQPVRRLLEAMYKGTYDVR